MNKSITQKDRAIQILSAGKMVRMKEFLEAGVSATTINRMVEAEEVFQADRGVYLSYDAPVHAWHSYAVTAKIAPKSVVCLNSALAYHEMTDWLFSGIWLAIGSKDWAPQFDHLNIEYARFSEPYLTDDIITEEIEGVPVRVYSPARTIADCFRHRRIVGTMIALEGLQKAIREDIATPADIVMQSKRRGVYTIVKPYLDTLLVEAKYSNA